MKHNKNANTLWFLLSFTKSQCEKNIEITLFVSASTQKGWETAGSGNTLPQSVMYPEVNLGTPRARSASVGKSAGGL